MGQSETPLRTLKGTYTALCPIRMSDSGLQSLERTNSCHLKFFGLNSYDSLPTLTERWHGLNFLLK